MISDENSHHSHYGFHAIVHAIALLILVVLFTYHVLLSFPYFPSLAVDEVDVTGIIGSQSESG